MKLNLTTVLLAAALGFVGWTFFKQNFASKSLTSNPTGGSTSTGPKDTFSQVAGDVTAILKGIFSIAQTVPSTQGSAAGTSV